MICSIKTMFFAILSFVEVSNVVMSQDGNQSTITNEKQDDANKAIDRKGKKRVHAITDLPFGNPIFDTDQSRIEIYISPSCLHCCKFLVEDFEYFIQQNRDKCFIKIQILPTTAKDLFVMKLIQSEAKDQNGYCIIFVNYIRRLLVTINKTKPTDKQRQLYKGSVTDPEMIKFQVVASEFGFSDEKILAAIPHMNLDYERAVMCWYKNIVCKISGIVNNKELELPLIVQNGKSYKNLKDLKID